MNDFPDWKKALDRGTSMHTVLAEKKTTEGPDWIQTPAEQEIVWEVNKFAVEHFGKSKWSAIQTKLKMELLSSLNIEILKQKREITQEEWLEMMWEKLSENSQN